jgi:dephospho-CoA kinase
VLTEDGELDRPKVGGIVFADEEKRRLLEGIIHPLVRKRSSELAAEAGPDVLVVHDIPLLAEAGLAEAFDAVIVVDAPDDIQVERMLRDRGWTREDAESRIAAQATREERLAIATYVIENTGTLEDLRARVEEVYRELSG